MFMVFTKHFFAASTAKAATVLDLIGLVLLPALGGCFRWPFLAFLLNSVK